MSNPNQNEKELIQNIPPEQKKAEKGILPDRLGETTGKESVKIEFLMDPKEKGYLTALAGLMKHKTLEDFLTDLVTDELKSRYFSTNGRRHAELDFALDCWDIKLE